MELELCRETVNCFEAVRTTTVCQEETQEAIVPDACPDILRILDTRAQAFLTGKQVRDGMVSVTGLVRANVFYLPEEAGTGPHHMEITLPFTCQSEAPGLKSHGTVLAVPRVRWAQARTLNPRKVLLRADLAVEISAYQPNTVQLSCGVNAGQEYGIEQLVAEEHTYVAAAVMEKPFTFSDRWEVGGAGQEPCELLCVEGTPLCNECKLIGNKLIFKGEVALEGLVCAAGELRTVRQSMAFSQIMEVSGAGEDSFCEVRVVLTDLSLSSADGEITLELLAQAVVREQRTLRVLKDLYSTGWESETTSQSYPMYHVLEDGVRTASARELLETTTLVHTVVHSWAELGEIRLSREREQPVFVAEVHLNLIYLDDGEQLQSVHKVISAACPAEGAGECAQCWCCGPRELFAAPSAGGIEVRFSLEFHCLSLAQRQSTGILSAVLTQERQKGSGAQPSVVLRLAAPGERLWDIAKAYATTAEEISQANELENGELPSGKMLLIPRVR